jgi:APA family basic amino acid/polyamine antiporter
MSSESMSGGSTPGLFTRKATGLVREARTVDALFYNVMWASVALSFSFAWLFYAFYPGANLAVSFLIAAAMGVPGAFLYAMLSQIMPRTGGDYVFNSRSLSPSIGFAANFSFCFWLAIIYGLYTTYMASYGFGAMGRMIAGFTGSQTWLSIGDWFSTEAGLFITGTVALLLSAAIFVVGGLRLFLRLQVVVFALYALGTFLIPVIVGLVQTKAGFLANFNDYAANLGVSNATVKLAASGAEGGFVPSSGFDTTMTLKSVTVFWYIFGFIYASNYFAGEIRMRKGTHLLSIPGALLVAVVFIGALLPVYLGITGYDFNSLLGLADPAAYGFAAGAPAYPEVMGIASGSWVVGLVIIGGFTLGLLVWLPQTMLLISRAMFAWSFDRIMPERLSYVDPRTHAPVVSIAIVTVLGIASTAIYAFTDWFTTLAVLLGLTITLAITAIGGIVLPFRQKAMVDNSPYGKRIAGIPLLSIVAFFALIGFGLGIGVLLWDESSGASLALNPGKLWLALGVYVVAFIIYGVSSAVRRSQGIDLKLAHRELPPE